MLRMLQVMKGRVVVVEIGQLNFLGCSICIDSLAENLIFHLVSLYLFWNACYQRGCFRGCFIWKKD